MLESTTNAATDAAVTDKELLTRGVNSITRRQVIDLEIDFDGHHVKVTGRTRTYYIKQLATHAIRALCPAARLENEILVCAG